MGWRVVYVKTDVKVSIKDEHLFLKKIETEEEFKIILNDVDSIIFESNRNLVTSSFLTETTNNNIMVLFCDENFNPIANVLPISGYFKKYEQVKNQLNWRDKDKSKAWEYIVKNKIINQKKILDKFDCKREVKDRLEKFSNDTLGFDDMNNEGLAAKMYFRELFGKSFNRDADIPTNWALNYGYTILLSKVNRAIASKGLLVEYGIKHKNSFNHYNLSSDLMEIFRPLIDFTVYKNTHQTSVFTSSEREDLINVLNYKIKFNDKFQYLTYGIDQYINSFIQFMNSEKEEILSINIDDIIDNEN